MNIPIVKTLSDYQYSRAKPASYSNKSASALIKSGAGIFCGLFVASHSGGSYKLWDSTSAATTILVNTTTASTGYHWYPETRFDTGLYLTITNTADVTVFYK